MAKIVCFSRLFLSLSNFILVFPPISPLLFLFFLLFPPISFFPSLSLNFLSSIYCIHNLFFGQYITPKILFLADISLKIYFSTDNFLYHYEFIFFFVGENYYFSFRDFFFYQQDLLFFSLRLFPLSEIFIFFLADTLYFIGDIFLFSYRCSFLY